MRCGLVIGGVPAAADIYAYGEGIRPNGQSLLVLLTPPVPKFCRLVVYYLRTLVDMIGCLVRALSTFVGGLTPS